MFLSRHPHSLGNCFVFWDLLFILYLPIPRSLFSCFQVFGMLSIRTYGSASLLLYNSILSSLSLMLVLTLFFFNHNNRWILIFKIERSHSLISRERQISKESKISRVRQCYIGDSGNSGGCISGKKHQRPKGFEPELFQV